MKENKISGVYSITNNVTGELYIGSSKDIEKRWVGHRSPSTHKRHPNSKLYKDMAKYGLGNFIFEVLEETADLREREQYYIEQLKPVYNSMYADGIDTERRKEAIRRCCKEYYEIHRDERLAYGKAYRQAHRNEHLAKCKTYKNRLCLYEGETLTLNALAQRFRQQGIAHPYIEAKNYLMTGRD